MLFITAIREKVKKLKNRSSMESQLARPHGHVYEEDPAVEVKPIGLHSVVEGDQEEHGEKKSVMKKVKAKARKLKDSITKHGHSHDEHHIPDDHDLDEEEDGDEDEEMIADPEIHGAPMYDSATATAAGFAHSAPSKSPGDREQLFDPRRDENISRRGKLGNMEHLRNDYEGGGLTPTNTPLTAAAPRTTQLSDDPTRVLVRGHGSAPKVNLTRPHGLEEDPEGPASRSRPPPNYETKVTGPTNSGGNEAKIDPLSSSFGKMKIGDKGEAKTSRLTGSHDQFSPEQPSKEDEAPLRGSGPGSYTEKITSATAAVADKAVAAKNLMASKLGYGTTEGEGLPKGGGAYTEKLGYGGSEEESTARSWVRPKSTTEMVAEKLAGVGEAVMSKVSGGGGGADAGTGPNSVSVREYWVEKLRPGEEDKALSEVISGALNAGKNNKDTSRRAAVTESEEVRQYLGESGKDEGQLSAPGKYVVESLKGTVESWFGKAGESNPAPHHGEEHVRERRLQESSQ